MSGSFDSLELQQDAIHPPPVNIPVQSINPQQVVQPQVQQQQIQSQQRSIPTTPKRPMDSNHYPQQTFQQPPVSNMQYGNQIQQGQNVYIPQHNQHHVGPSPYQQPQAPFAQLPPSSGNQQFGYTHQIHHPQPQQHEAYTGYGDMNQRNAGPYVQSGHNNQVDWSGQGNMDPNVSDSSISPYWHLGVRR